MYKAKLELQTKVAILPFRLIIVFKCISLSNHTENKKSNYKLKLQ